MSKQRPTHKKELTGCKKFLYKQLKYLKRGGLILESKDAGSEIHLPLLIITFLFLALSAINFNKYFSETIKKPLTLGENTDHYLEKEKKLWITYLKNNPSYINGWLELTKIEYEMGNITQAIRSLEKAKNINPNLLKVKNTEMELGL